MDASKYQERAAARFEKVLRLYWDGLPILPFVLSSQTGLLRTFKLRELNYSPDYYGEVSELVLTQEESEFKGFYPLTKWEAPNPSITCRIGSHYSPYVGVFRYYNTKEGISPWASGDEEISNENQVKIIRIPKDPCELPQEWDNEMGSKFRKYVRTSKLCDLYYPIVKEFCPITLSSLRQIVKLGTIGIPPHCLESVIREVQAIKTEYTRWICECVFYYMSIDQLFWKILVPLQLIRSPQPVPYEILSLPPEERAESKASFLKARNALMESIAWRKDTQNYFLSLRTLWNSRLKRLVFFDLTTKEWLTEAEKFGKQIKGSLRSAFARIRIEFYSYAEEFFFTYVANARSSIFLSEQELGNSIFQRIFVATRLFLTEEVRTSVLEGLEKMVEFFSCFGNFRLSCMTSKRIAEKHPVIGINLAVSEGSVPRAIDFSIFVTVLRSLFDDIREKSKELPRVEYVFFPSLRFDKEPINFISETEIAGYRSVLMEILDEVSAKIDSISAIYFEFSILPSKDESITRRGNETEIRKHIQLLRDKYYGVLRATSDVVFCGRFAINCRGIKEHYARKWEEFLLKFYDELHKSTRDIIEKVEEKCLRAQKALHKNPVTVADLEQYLIECTTAKNLVESVQNVECQDIIKRFRCMEESHVPIDNNLYYAAEKMMKWPQILLQDLRNAEIIKQKSRPLLRDHVARARRETRDHINTLSTGVTELYNMFNLEICDIAAQTCIELGELVLEIRASIQQIHHQEKALGIPTTDNFQDFYPLVNHFEIIEQFWMTIYKSQALKEYYSSPIRGLSAKMIETEREWRRLLHSSVRYLRGYPPLVRLGRQQEAVLAKFETLEEFINLASTPGMRKQHWKEIGRLLYSKLQEDANLVTEMNISLQRLLDADVLLYLPEIKRIVGEASADFSAESILEQMKSSSKKIHFKVETMRMSVMTTRLYLPDEVHTEILSHIETYVKTCRDLRWKSGLSSAIMKALNEWEASAEKMRDMLIQWKKIEDQWVPFENYFVTVQKSQKKERKLEMVPIHDCLIRAHDAFHQLYLKIGKPQFSLYMAIVQETVMEHLTAAKTALAELRPMLGEICEKKRAGFPRFYFLTDDQLVTYLSAFNVNQLHTLLPYIYPRLRRVEIQQNCVVAFTTDSGFTIKADPVLPLIDSSPTEWMSQFDIALSRSVFTFIKECCLDYGKNLLEKWIEGHCPQMLVMGLRVAHTKRMRETINFSQEKGLRAYQLQLKHVKQEFCRMCTEKNCPAKKRAVIGELLSYLFNAEVDVATALSQRISNLTELDGTSMVQTFLNDSDTTTRILGVDFINGTEFYGSYALNLVMAPETVEHIAILLMLTLLGKASPTVCGVNRNFLPSIAVSIIGRYCIPIQCFPTMTVDSILSYCRGAIQIGGILCFHDVEQMSPEIHVLLREIFAKVSRVSSLKSIKSGEYSTVTLPLGPSGTVVPIQVNPYFASLFTCQDYNSLSMTVAFDTRPIHMPPADCTGIIRGSLYAYGFTDEFTSSLLFGTFFEIFHRVRPEQFTIGCLTHVVQLAGSQPHPSSMIERLCDAFVRFYFSTLQDDSSIKDLCISSMVDVLGMDSKGPFFQDVVRRLSYPERQHSQEFFSRFADLMTTSRKVILSGPPFSGKTNAWKKWVRDLPYYIFSPSLMSSADFFGYGNSPGVVPALGEENQSTNHRYVIVEGGSHLRNSFWGQIEEYARLFVGDKAYLVGKSSFIITTRRLHHMNPGIMSGFSQFNMSVPFTWNRFLKKCLSGCPHFDLVFEIMEVVLGALFEGFRVQTNNSLSPLYVQTEHQLAAVMRCSNLCKKWFEHGKTRLELSPGDQEDTIGERGYAAHCAVFSCIWGIGLGLPSADRGVISWALESSEQALQYIVESFDITVSALPSFSKPEANNILNLIPTPCGWRTHERAKECGFLYPWSTHVHLSPQQPMSFQVFEMPSRLPVVQAAECLLDCGENIIFCGDAGSGRSTLLHTTRYCDQWSPCYIGCSKGISAASICGKISSRLFRRSNGVYGPAMGRRLTVCVDDLHLSDMVEENLPLAANVIGFCTKFNYLVSSSSGCVEVTDVLFCGASNHQRMSATVSRACTEIYLPPLVGDELAGGLWQLFEGCCAKKRVEHLPRQAAVFIAVAHSYYIRCIRHLRFPKRSLYFSGYDILLTSSLELLPERFRDVMRGSEMVRSSLLSTMPDIQVIGNTFRFVEELYSAMLLFLAPESIGVFREHLGKAANITLGLCTQDDSFKKIQVLNDIPFSTATPSVQDTVEGWISSLAESVDLQKIEVLETLLTKGQESASPKIDAEYGNSSVLISFPSGLSPTKKGGGHFPRRASMRGAGAFRQAARKISAGQGYGRLSHTYPTTWLVSHVNFLVKALRHDEFHFMFVGTETFGLERLLRVVCHTGGMPLAIFRGSGPQYTKASFWKELKASIFSALAHDSVTVVYIPLSVLQVDGVISLIDPVIRAGDVSELFSGDELTALAKGYSITQRSLRELSAVELLELCRRVQHLVHFIFHFDTGHRIREYGEGYPFITHLFPLSLHSSHSIAQFRMELVTKILEESQPKIPIKKYRDKMEREVGSLKEAAELICFIYDTIQEDAPNKLEQLFECAHLARNFRAGLIKSIQYNMRMKAAVSTNGLDGKKHRAEMAENMKKLLEIKAEKKELNIQLADDKDAIMSCEEVLSTAKKRLNAKEEENRQIIALKAERENRKRRALRAAAHGLKNAKSLDIRNFSQCRAPLKGSLLVNAVLWTLGKAPPPNTKNNPTELWNFGLKTICKPGFAESLMEIQPETVGDRAALLEVKTELNELHFTGSLKYAQLIVEYILALTEMLGTEEHQVNITTTKNPDNEINMEVLYSQLQAAEEVLGLHTERIATLDKMAEKLEDEKQALVKRGVVLDGFALLVDKFVEFLEETETKHTEIVQGDILMVSALFSLMLMHRNVEKLFRRVQGAIFKKGIRSSHQWEKIALEVIFPAQNLPFETVVPIQFPPRHRLVLYGLLGGIYTRWPLLGGVTDMFEDTLVEFVKFQCRYCRIVSAYDSSLKSSIVDALKDGSGLLIRDMVGEWAAEQLRPLHHVLPRIGELREMHGGKIPPQTTFTMIIFGKEVEVNACFFMVATSATFIPSENRDHFTQFFHVINLFELVSQSYRYERLLFHAPSVKNLQDEIVNKRQLVVDEFHSLMGCYETSTDFIASEIVDDDPSKLQVFSDSIDDLSRHYTLLRQYYQQYDSLRLKHATAWSTVADVIERCAENLQFIEFHKLERPWCDIVLNEHIRGMCILVPQLVTRIAPRIFMDLPLPERHFYAIVNFLGSLLRGFSKGWPGYLRGFFSLLLLSDVICHSIDIQEQRGVLFSGTTALLNNAQVATFRGILSDDGLNMYRDVEKDDHHTERALKEALRSHYLHSNDPLLLSLASQEGGTIDEDEALVDNFFFSLLEVNLAKAGSVGEELVNNFFTAVMDSSKGASEREGSLTEAENHEEGGKGRLISPTVNNGGRAGKTLRSTSESDGPRQGGKREGGNILPGGGTPSTPGALSESRRGWPAPSDAPGTVPTGGSTAQGKEGEKVELGLPALRVNVSELDLFYQSATFCIPFCMLTPINEESSLISRLRHYTLLLGWEFRWIAVTTVEVIRSVTHLLLQLFYRTSTNQSGIVLALHVDLPAHLAVPSFMLSPAQREELVVFKEEFARIMHAYHGRRRWRTGGGGSLGFFSAGGSTSWKNFYLPGPKSVNLAFIVSREAHNVLCGNCEVHQYPLPIIRSLYFFPLFFTPQQHLDALLKTVPHLQKTLSQGNFLLSGIEGGNTSDRGNFAASRSGWNPASTNGFRMSHVGSLGSTTGAGLLAGSDGMRRNSMSLGRNWESNRLGQLRKMVLLAAKELLIVHVAMAQRFRMIQFNWLRHHHFLCPSRYGRSQKVNDENLTLLLMLLQGWMEWSETVLQEIEETFGTEEEGEHAGVPSTESLGTENGAVSVVGRNPAFPTGARRGSTVIIPPPSPRGPPFQGRPPLHLQNIGKEVGTIFGMTKNRERYAHLFYRQQLRGFQWKIEREPSWSRGSGLGGGLRSPRLSLADEDMLPFSSQGGKSSLQLISQHYSSVLSYPDCGPPKLSFGIFNTLQKMTFQVLSSSGLSWGEVKGLEFILNKVVVSPSQSQVVPCDYTPIRPRCPLLLDHEGQLSDFQTEIAEMTSDLVELCGDAFATVAFREAVKQRMQAFLFYYAEGEKEGWTTVPSRGSVGSKVDRSRDSSSVGSGRPASRGQGSKGRESPGTEKIPQGKGSAPAVGGRAVGEFKLGQATPVPRSQSREGQGRSAAVPFGRVEQRMRFPRVLRHNSDEQSTRPTFHALHPTVRASRWHLLYRDSYLSETELAPVPSVAEYCGPWLQVQMKSPPPEPTSRSSGGPLMLRPRARSPKRRVGSLPTSEKAAWELEKPHAVQLLQFYFSQRNQRLFREERERLVSTYAMLSTCDGTAACDSIRSCWLSALGNPTVTLRLLASAVHNQLSARLASIEAKEEMQEMKEEGRVGGKAEKEEEQKKKEEMGDHAHGVKSLLIIVTLRRLLCGGDVVLSRAYFSASLQENIKKVTGWKDEWFPHFSSTPTTSDRGNASWCGDREGWEAEESSPLGGHQGSLGDYALFPSMQGPSRQSGSLQSLAVNPPEEEVVVAIRMMEKRISSSEQTITLLETPAVEPDEERPEELSDGAMAGKRVSKEEGAPGGGKPRKVVLSEPAPVEEARAYTWQLPPRMGGFITPHRSSSVGPPGSSALSSTSRRRSSVSPSMAMMLEMASGHTPTFFTTVPLGASFLERRGSAAHPFLPESGGKEAPEYPFSRTTRVRYQRSATPIDILYESRVLRERSAVAVAEGLGLAREASQRTAEERSRKLSNGTDHKPSWAMEKGSGRASMGSRGRSPPRVSVSAVTFPSVALHEEDGAALGTAGQEGPPPPSPAAREGGGGKEAVHGTPSLFSTSGELGALHFPGSSSLFPAVPKPEVVMSCPTPTAAAVFSSSSLGKVPAGNPYYASLSAEFSASLTTPMKSDKGTVSSYFIDTVWERMGPEDLCVVWESDEPEDMSRKGLEIPLQGLTEYYIYVR